MKNKLNDLLYGYNTNEFMPVFENGKLLNKSEYTAYKAKKALIALQTATVKVLERMEQ